jgi:hypothetical protein
MGLFAVVGSIAAIAAIVIAFVPPSQFGSTPLLKYVAILLSGVLVLGLSGQVIFQMRKPSWLTVRPDESPNVVP